jgi:hypothetical protein
MDQSSSSTFFDLNSQAGVMSLLVSIRNSQLSPAEKNELRDLVFLYTNGGGDASVKISLLKKLETANIQPVAPKTSAVKEEAPAVVRPFGSSRPAPVFKVPVVETKSELVASNPVTVAASKEPVNAPAQPIAAVVKEVSAPAPEVPAQSAPVMAQVAPVPEPAAPTAPQSMAAMDDNSAYLNRIREIKASVNSQVGNPVNLVDIDNTVGREYMNALLDAMKKLSGGASSQMEESMARLEASFAAVNKAISNHKASGEVPAKTEAKPSAPVTDSNPVTTTDATPQTTVTVSETSSQVAPPKTHDEPVSNPYSVAPLVEAKPEPKPVVSAVPVRPLAKVDLNKVATGPSGFDNLPPSAPSVAAPATAAAAFASTAPTAPEVKTPADLPSSASIVGDIGDPLYTKEVDDGLEQLLGDWVLFKKSGLFGTGPKGREHPLFLKIAKLQVPLLLAGRFEGSTQEIRQSITDYMNGWRYEQGIIYEQGEEFEHYLRRVIRHILDLQKKRVSA